MNYGRDEVYLFIKSENLKIKKTQYTTEKNVENVIAKQLLEKFKDVHQQYNIGGFLGLKCDIDLYDGKIGIELKLAKDLKSSSNIERLFGQAIYYNKRCYKGNLIVLVVGTLANYNSTMKEIERLMSDIDVRFLYKVID